MIAVVNAHTFNAPKPHETVIILEYGLGLEIDEAVLDGVNPKRISLRLTNNKDCEE
jgi:hypothetical protein